MGNPLRNRDPEIYRVITVRTVRGEMWIMPNSKNTRSIGGILARYQELLGIETYAYAVLSNHIGEVPHKMSRSPRLACYTKCGKLLRGFLEDWRLLVARYSEASLRFRLGNSGVKFPAFTFPPLTDFQGSFGFTR